jgi:hypothetical protein
MELGRYGCGNCGHRQWHCYGRIGGYGNYQLYHIMRHGYDNSDRRYYGERRKYKRRYDGVHRVICFNDGRSKRRCVELGIDIGGRGEYQRNRDRRIGGSGYYQLYRDERMRQRCRYL